MSHSVKDPSSPAARWLKTNKRFLQLLGAILAIVHPEQFETGMQILYKIWKAPTLLRQDQFVADMLAVWACPFSGISVLCNARTPAHRDRLGQDNWYDILAPTGTYAAHTLDLPGLEIALPYNARSIVAICGRILAHATDFAPNGERVTFACFMRENVRKGMGLPRGTYSTIANLKGWDRLPHRV